MYSHSRLSAFENCPRQFRFKYVDKIEAVTEGIEAFLGKRVHEILERLYLHVQRYGQPPSLFQVHERFRKDWEHHWHENVQIVRSEFDVPHYQDLGVRCLSNYYRSNYPFDDGETVGVEWPVLVDLDPEGQYRVRGIVDRVVRRPGGHYEIHDYKTGGWLPPRKRLDSDRQLALYQLGLAQTYPDAQSVELIWHYVQFNKLLRSERSPEQLDDLRSSTIDLIKTIERTDRFPPSTGPLCRWCEYRPLCPEGGEHAGDGRAEPPGLEPPPPGLDAAPAGLGDANAARPDRSSAGLGDLSRTGTPAIRFKGGVQLSLFD